MISSCDSCPFVCGIFPLQRRENSILLLRHAFINTYLAVYLLRSRPQLPMMGMMGTMSQCIFCLSVYFEDSIGVLRPLWDLDNMYVCHQGSKRRQVVRGTRGMRQLCVAPIFLVHRTVCAFVWLILNAPGDNLCARPEAQEYFYSN